MIPKYKICLQNYIPKIFVNPKNIFTDRNIPNYMRFRNMIKSKMYVDMFSFKSLKNDTILYNIMFNIL